jgi:sugar O-acyltransferase (sialic acid O-acetyltransferase NeuD family)
MKHYFILGSGGFAKEVYFLASEVLDSNYQFGGFIDRNTINDYIEVRKHKVKVWDENIFLSQVLPQNNTTLFMGVGDPKLLLKLSVKFQEYHFPNLIHPSFVGDFQSIQLGRGNIICAGCIFTVDIQIGSFNVFNLGVTVGHDTRIENGNVFNPGVNVSGGVQMGSGNLLGTNATVLQYLSIGNYTTLGAASLATKSIEDHQVMIGVPAKPLNR